jgi:hypothetical protein
VDLPAAILTRVRAAIADLDGSFDWGRLGRQHDAIPLLLTIGTMIFLRSDGAFLEYEGDPFPERLVRETTEVNPLALAWGVERYPWLEALIPPRPPNGRDCGTCGGKVRLGSCPSCAGLGWVAE